MFTLDIKSELKQESLWEKTYMWYTSLAEHPRLDIQSHRGHFIYFTISKGPGSFGGSGKAPMRIYSSKVDRSQVKGNSGKGRKEGYFDYN